MVWSEGVFAFYKLFCVTLLIYLTFEVLYCLCSAFSSGSPGKYYSLGSQMGTFILVWSSKWAISVVKGIWGGEKKVLSQPGVAWPLQYLSKDTWSISSSILISLEILQGLYFMLYFHVCMFTQELLVLYRAIKEMWL